MSRVVSGRGGPGLARMSSSILLIAASLALAPAARAAPSADKASAVKYSKKTERVRTRSTLDTKLSKAKKAAKAERQRLRPGDTQRALAGEREAIAQAVAEKQIAVLHRLIRASDPRDADYPGYFFRLADLHLGSKVFFERQAGALYDKIHEHREAGRTKEAAQAKAQQRRLLKQARAQSEAAVKAYAHLLSNERFATYDRLDEALYYYAFELGQLGREAQMQQAFARLVRDFPTSKFVPNVYLAFGDHKFKNGEIPDALRLYERIVAGYPDSPVYAYALYKIAWCHLNPVGTAEPKYDASLDHFVATIKATLEGKAGSEANGRYLRRDARRDLVRAYVHAGRPSKAWDFFKKVGRGPTKEESMDRDMMERLADAYFGEGMYVESSAIYHALQSIFSDDPDTCVWQGKVVINALATDDKSIQWKEAEALANRYKTMKERKLPKSKRKRCHDATRDTLLQLATTWHDEADKTGRQGTYDLAEKAYVAYGEVFGKTKTGYEMAYYHAELLWQQAARAIEAGKTEKERAVGRQKFKAAHEAFVKVLERAPKGRYAKDAAYAQMLAMKNYLDYDETAGEGTGCRVTSDGECVYRTRGRRRPGQAGNAEALYPPKPFSDDEKAMLAAYDRYVELITAKNDAERPKILYHRAKLMVDHNRFDDAKPLLTDLIGQYDGTIYSAWASEMLLDLLTIRWADAESSRKQRETKGRELERWARRMQKMKLWKHRESERVRQRVPVLISAVGWRRAEDYRLRGEEGDPEGFELCAKQYLDIYNAHDDHDRADALLFNAARCMDAAYMIGGAINAREALLKQYPASEHSQQTLREVAENYQAIAFYERAAQRFEDYAEAYGKKEYSATALQNAYLFRLGLGDRDKASEDLERYEAMYKRKDPVRAAEIFWSKHAILADEDERLAHAREYISTYKARGGNDRLAVAHAEVGQILWRRSCKRKLLNDTCVTIQRRRATAGEKHRNQAAEWRRLANKGIPERCGSADRAVVTVHRRDERLAKEAQAHFDKVLSLVGRRVDVPKDDKPRVEAFRNAWGMAMVYQADQTYEEYLAIEMPTDLDFGTEHMWKKDSGRPRLEREYREAMQRRAQTQKKVQSFYDRKMALAHELIERYAKVKASNSPHWMLAGAARTAMLAQNFADQLYRAPVPKAIKTEQMYQDYCDEIATRAAEPQKMATRSFEYCLERSTKFQYFNEYSRLCEQEMQQRHPDAYPATNELFGRSRYTDAKMDRVGVQLDFETDR